MKHLGLIDFNQLSEDTIIKLRLRSAARAVVFDREKRVALLYVSRFNYYKLPGGGIEENENRVTALKRECLEEIGCNVNVLGEIGHLKEYRGDLNQDSYCYLAEVIGEKSQSSFTELETAEGFRVQWLSLPDAIRCISETKTDEEDGIFIQARDGRFLREAERLLNAEEITLSE